MEQKLKEEALQTAPKPHIPDRLPFDLCDILIKPEVIKLMSKACMAMGTYKGFLINTPNPMLLISPLISQEAVLSSKLEGTHATLEDLLNFDAGNSTPIEQDEMAEIQNYRDALYYALENMSKIYDNLDDDKDKIPLSSRLIKEMHKILLNNVRGEKKQPGVFKTSQNYIGWGNSVSHTPVPPELTLDYMSNLENYIHYDELDLLVQSAIIHAQFEMIHPFKDGNGRIGRLLIPLFLYYRKLLPYPTFYMSSYFEKDRSLYIDKLSKISQNNDWLGWITYFLEGIVAQSDINTSKAFYLLNFYNDVIRIANTELNSKHSIEIIDFIFENPIFKAKQLISKDIASNNTIYSLLNQLVKLNILSTNDKDRNKTYYCPKILSFIDL